MSKRPASPAASSSSSSSGDSEPSFINVDFLFSSPSALDYHALKRLTQQLFYTHAAHLDLGAIAQETIDAAGKWGSVVKVDQQSEEGGEEEDPYAFVGAFDLAASTAASQSLRAYFLARSASCASISSLLASSSADAANAAASPSTLLVLHERMVNLPPAIALPLYRMLFDEIAASPTQPDNLLFFSRIFNADAFSDDEMSDAEGGDAEDKPRGMKGAAKKRRKAAASLKTAKTAPPPKARLAEGEYGLFHPEDAVFAQFASHTHTFRFPPPPDAAEAFEAPLFGRLVVVPWRQAGEMLQRLEALLAQGGAA